MYKLGETTPSFHEGVCAYLYENYKEDENEELVQDFKARIVDDANLKGSLAIRRLTIMSRGGKLFKLKQAFFFLGDLIKVAKSSTWFIDSNGRVFQYKKQTSAKLVFYKVDKILRIPSGGVIVVPHGLNQRFKSLFAPTIPLQDLHIGVLQFGMSSVLYGFYDKKYDTTWRMV